MARSVRIPPQSITLPEALDLQTVAQLKELLDLLPDATRPSRKAEILAALQRHLAGERLEKLWGRLDEIQQSAVSETLYGPDGEFVTTRFRAKYEVLPELDITIEHRRSRIRRPSPLRLFLYNPYRYGGGALVIPRDLQERLRVFVPRPAAPTLPTLDELPELPEPVEEGRSVSRRGGGDEGTSVSRHGGDGERTSAVPGKSLRPTPTGSSRDGAAAARPAPLVRRDMERAAQQDLLAVLRLIDHGKVAVGAKTLRASAAGVRNVAEVLYDGDFYDPAPEKRYPWEQTIGPVRAFAWPWLVQAAKLAERHGARLALTRAGRAALSAPPADTLRRLWRRWLKSTLLDEFSRIDAIKGQQRGKGRHSMTAASSRRPVIAEALEQCPVGRWVRTGDFSRFMQASGSDFSITRDPWKLYIAEPHYGSLGYDGYHGWHILQERYLLCFLFEYAATLGLIDVACSDPRGAREDYRDLWGTDDLKFLSRYDGLQYFRLNPLGAFCLGLAESYEPAAPQARASLAVFPNLRLEVTEAPLSPEERLLLETYATAESETAWRLDRDKTLSAIESGHPASDLRDFLTSRDDQPLPEMVEGFLRTTERRARALTPRGAALLIECADADLAAMLATHERTAKLCLRTGERHLTVRAGSEDTFRKVIRALGYGMPRA